MRKDIDDTFNKKIYECRKHIEKLSDAKEYLKDMMPLTLESYQKIDKIQSSFIDQLNFRFSKLQDTVGESILKGVLIKSEENIERMTFLDILNRLEKLDILDKSRWLELREVRNEVVDNINLIYEKSDDLISIYNDVYKFVQKIEK